MSDKARERLAEIIADPMGRKYEPLAADYEAADAILTEYVHKDELREAVRLLNGISHQAEEDGGISKSLKFRRDMFLAHAEKVLGG